MMARAIGGWRVLTPLLAVLAFVAGSEAARASTVNITGFHAIDGGHDQEFIYTAAAGEANNLTITRVSNGTYEDRYEIEDTGAVIVLPTYLTDNPEGPRDPICSRISPNKVRCDSLGNDFSGAFTTVRLGDLNDSARVTPPVQTEIFGDAGNDTISSGALFDDLRGGDGDDHLVSTDSWNDRFFGGAGNDVFESSEDPVDLDTEGGAEGAGIDTFDFSNRNADITAVSGPGNPFEGVENFIGGAGDDTLTGDDGPNSLVGGRGDDTLSGLGGDDTFEPGPGPGQDGILVYSDDDAVNGGDGLNDLVTYKNRTGDLTIDADGVADDGGPSSEDDNVGTTVEHIHGGSGDDSLTGNASNNVLNGWTGADVLFGGDGTADVASYEGRGADLVLTLDGATNDGDPAANAGAGEGDRIRFSIENVWGGRGDDDITGNSFFFNMSGSSTGINELRGGWGDDDLDGEGQNDILRGNGFTELVLSSDADRLDGGDGNDTLQGDTRNAVFLDPEPDDLIGGAGTDVVDYSERTANLTIDIPEPPPSPFILPAADDGQSGEGDRVYSSVENVDGGAGSDAITGSNAANVLSGGSDGSDALNGAGADDTLNGGNESGTGAVGDALGGGEGLDTLNGGDDRDTLSGGNGADTLNGDADADALAGEAGVDTLNGGGGQDALSGGDDGDTLSGGGGFNDVLNGDAGADSLSTGTSNAATLNGGADGDTLSSVGATLTGITQLNGGAGADTLIPGTAARDVVAGGDGTDLASYAGRSVGVTVTVGNGSAFDDGQAGIANGDDRIEADVENVTGGPAGDSLTGSAAANTLDGGAGPDTLVGGDGADSLLGGTEDDHLKSRDSFADQDNCGAGAADKVTFDGQDTRTGCERSAPNQTAAPTISGTPRDGQTLDADPGAWEGEATIAFAYRWRRCDADGVSNCADIPGNTADDESYTATPQDVGRTLRVRVTAINTVDAATAESAPTGAVAADPPSNTAGPTISGTLRDAETVTADPGTWSGTPPLAYAYQWRSCDAQNDTDCTAIAGATGATFAITPAQVGRRLRVQTTATNAAGAGQAATAESDASAVVVPAPPANTSAPTAAGQTQSGGTMTADAGSWSGTPPISHAYQWQSCDADSGACTDIAGAQGQSLTLTSAEVARRVRVRVTATNAGGSAVAESAHSKVITASGDPGPGGLGGSGSPSNSFSIVGTAISSKNGRATLTVDLPGPGILDLIAASPPSAVPLASAPRRVVVARILRNVTQAGRLLLVIKPRRQARAILKRKHRLKIGVRVTYTPSGGTAGSIRRTLTLKLRRR